MYDDDSVRCALPGCRATIELVDGRAQRKYCTAGHRALARRFRREREGRPEAPDSGLLGPDDPGGLDEARGALDDPRGRHDPYGLRGPADPDPFDSMDGLPWMPVRPPGRPARRLAAGSLGTTTWEQPSTLPKSLVRARQIRAAAAQRRRRRAIAILGAAGILAGGGSWVATGGPGAHSDSSQGGATAGAAGAPDGGWATDAQVALVSVNSQLDLVAQTADAWSRSAGTAGAVPPQVTAMLQRKTLLEQQRATLESELATWHSVQDVKGQLGTAEGQLASVQSALSAIPTAGALSSEQHAAVTQLSEQREVRLQQRDAIKKQLDTLNDGVQKAVAAPLPDTAEGTQSVVQPVLELLRGPSSPPPADQPTRSPQAGLEPQEAGGQRPRDQVLTSAPPDPRGRELPVQDPPKGDLGAAVGNAVGKVANTAGKVTDSVGKAADGVGKATGKVADGVGKVTDGVGKVTDGVGKVAGKAADGVGKVTGGLGKVLAPDGSGAAAQPPAPAAERPKAAESPAAAEPVATNPAAQPAGHPPRAKAAAPDPAPHVATTPTAPASAGPQIARPAPAEAPPVVRAAPTRPSGPAAFADSVVPAPVGSMMKAASGVTPGEAVAGAMAGQGQPAVAPSPRRGPAPTVTPEGSGGSGGAGGLADQAMSTSMLAPSRAPAAGTGSMVDEAYAVALEQAAARTGAGV